MDAVETAEAAAKLLDRTADMIEERGHVKYRLEDDSGAVCLFGAMNVVQTGSATGFLSTDEVLDPWNVAKENVRNRASDALSAYLDLPVEFDRWYISARLVNWNNADERTPTEVIDACRHTAKVLRGN